MSAKEMFAGSSYIFSFQVHHIHLLQNTGESKVLVNTAVTVQVMYLAVHSKGLPTVIRSREMYDGSARFGHLMCCPCKPLHI